MLAWVVWSWRQIKVKFVFQALNFNANWSCLLSFHIWIQIMTFKLIILCYLILMILLCVLNLHLSLIQGTSVHLCSTILDVISSIYHQDSANYFILEPQNTLSQCAEKIHMKTEEIQVGRIAKPLSVRWFWWRSSHESNSNLAHFC